MQPNQNMPGMGQPANPVRPVSSAGAAGVAGPAKPVTPANNSAFNNGPSVVEGKGGKKTGWILAIVFLLIVAAGGVGFGVWTMMDGNAQKDALNSQISSLKQQNNSLQEQLDKMVVNNNVSDNTSDNDDGEDYVYVGEADYLEIEDWGIKIKIPQELTRLSYFLDNRTEKEGLEYLYLNAIFGSSDKTPSFIGNPKNYSLGCVTRASQDAESYDSLGKDDVVISLDGYDYSYSSSEMTKSTSKMDEALEIDTINAMANIFNNPENYSEI